MIVIRTDWQSFEEYLKSLSPSAQKNYSYVKKHNQDLIYERVPYERAECEKFMRLWEKQSIRGKTIQWAFPVEYVENLALQGKMLFFRGVKKDVGTISYHFVQLHEKEIQMIECHPPLYDKSENKRYLGKYMWFSLIAYAIEHKLPFLDLGGGKDNWVEMIKHRDEFPNPRYKWIYVPQKAKLNPDSEENFYLKIVDGHRIYGRL